VALRYPLIGFMEDRAPFAFNFVAVAGAAVLAGWRSGLVALVFGQLLTWYVIVENRWSFVIPDAERAWGLVAATFSQVLMLLVIVLYQREVDRGVAERERRLQLLEDARHEIDHRVRNNYQTVLALVQMQLQRASDEGERRLLQQVVDRIKAVSLATDRLAFRSENDLRTVRLREHLCTLCEDLQRGLSREEVSVQCEVSDVPANAVFATYLAIIVNELVTNALKHAFNGRHEGQVRVEARQQNSGLELIVADNGSGMRVAPASKGTGLGQRLVSAFVLQLGGKHEVSSSEGGTVHRIFVPSIA
jgi:two-component sensor histidine kinase